jgi:ribosomal protein L3 glutamine methyltransferase
LSDCNQKTVRELINEISFRFDEADLYYGHGTDNAFDEAVYLVFALLDIPFDVDDSKLNDILDIESYQKVIAAAHRRVTEKVPVAYLVNKAWFCGLPFYVNEKVLIPRSPIAELIEEAFTPWIGSPDRVMQVLDIGTGSGCIAVATALTFPEAEIDAVDIDTEALAVAKINVEQYELTDKVNLIHSDLFENLHACKYDLIVANPPYVNTEDMQQLPDEYRHEPVTGLAAGIDGLDLVRIILNKSKNHLNENGVLIVEVGNSRPALEAAFPQFPFIWLEFERGGEGVFLIYKEDLLKAIESTE